MRRDLTYVDDIIEAVERIIDRPPTRHELAAEATPDPAKSSVAPWVL
jgi:UDP-glucuronate 4-epimerase